MKRRDARESAFLLVFEYEFNKEKPLKDIISDAIEERELQVDDFATGIFYGVVEKYPEIDQQIKQYSKNWNIERITKTSIAILRVAVYEMLYTDVGSAIAINEAVELAKKYENETAAGFVNGILGSVAKNASKE